MRLLINTFLILFGIFGLVSSYCQAQVIRGRITDSLNLAIPGVLVESIDSLKNKTLTITDVFGTFRFRCNDCKYVYINSIDCKPKTIMVSNHNNFIDINAKKNIINTPVLVINKYFSNYEVDSSSYHSTFVDTIPGSDPDCMDNCSEPYVYYYNYAEPKIGYKQFYSRLFEVLKSATLDNNKISIRFTVKKDGEIILNSLNGLSTVNSDIFKKEFSAISNWIPGKLIGRVRESDYNMKIEIN